MLGIYFLNVSQIFFSYLLYFLIVIHWIFLLLSENFLTSKYSFVLSKEYLIFSLFLRFSDRIIYISYSDTNLFLNLKNTELFNFVFCGLSQCFFIEYSPLNLVLKLQKGRELYIVTDWLPRVSSIPFVNDLLIICF